MAVLSCEAMPGPSSAIPAQGIGGGGFSSPSAAATTQVLMSEFAEGGIIDLDVAEAILSEFFSNCIYFSPEWLVAERQRRACIESFEEY